MKVLITGSNGQLGSEIKDLASDYENLECVFKDLLYNLRKGLKKQ